MANINFPISPSIDDEYAFNGKTWKWNGTGWVIRSSIYNNIVYIRNTSGTPIQDAIDAIDTNDGQFLLMLDAGYFSETVSISNKPNIDISGNGSGSTSINKIIYSDTQALASFTVFSDFLVNELDITITKIGIATTLSFNNVQCLGNISATGSDILYNGLQFRNSFLTGSGNVFNDGFFISTDFTALTSAQINGSSVWQHPAGELYGTFELNDTSQAFIRNDGVHAFPLLVASAFTINDSAILNIDAGSFATMEITNNTGTEASIQMLEGTNAGVVSPKPVITDNGDGTIDIGAGQAFLYNNDHQFSLPRRFIIPAKTGVTLTDNKNNYIEIDYNAGAPEYIVGVTKTSNESSIVPVADYFREGIVLHEFDWDSTGEGLVNKIHRRIIDTEEFARKTGLALGEASGNKITITSGAGYFGAVPISFDECNSSTSEVYFYYPVSGVWTLKDPAPTTYNNTQYSDGTNLQTLLANKWVNNWIYRGKETDDHIYYVLGNTYVSSDLAQLEEMPTSLPEIILAHALLVGRITVEKSAASGIVQSAFVTPFIQSPTTNHGDLSNRDDADSHPASAIANTPAGAIAAITVQAALNELDTEKVGGIGIIGQVAEFVENTKTLQAAKLIGPTVNILTITNAAAATLGLAITAGKTLTLTSTDDYNLTIPASGTVALLGTANVFTAAQTIQASSGVFNIELISEDLSNTSCLFLTGYGVTNTLLPNMVGRAARGTKASPTALQENDAMFRFAGRGYGTTGWSVGRVAIDFMAAANWTDAAQGTYIRFVTTLKTSILPLEKMRLTDAGWLGINTQIPSSLLEVVETIATEPRGILSTEYSSDAAAAILLRRARGTEASPTNLLSGDALGNLSFAGRDGTSFVSSASIRAFALEDFSTTAHGTELRFYVTPVTTVTQAEAVRITNAGNVGIGTTNPTSRLHVVGSSDTDITVDNSNSPAAIHLRSQAVTYRELTADWAGIYTDSGTSGIFISDGSSTGAIKFVVNLHQTEVLRITSAGNLQFADAKNIIFNTTTGTKIGTATTQKLGFWNKTPVVQPSAYTITNDTVDRSLDCNSTSLDEVADVLGTLIKDLQSVGFVG
jgi:hypothetical protein